MYKIFGEIPKIRYRHEVYNFQEAEFLYICHCEIYTKHQYQKSKDSNREISENSATPSDGTIFVIVGHRHRKLLNLFDYIC